MFNFDSHFLLASLYGSFIVGILVWFLRDSTKHLMQPRKPQERAKSASSINFS